MKYNFSEFECYTVREARIEADKAFKELQQLSRDHDLPPWCNAENNLQQLLDKCPSMAILTYKKYIENTARARAIDDLIFGYANGRERGTLEE